MKNTYATKLRSQTYISVFRAKGTCLVVANVALPLGRGANSALQIPQLDLRGYFEAEEKEGKEKTRGNSREGRGRMVREKTPK